MEVKIGVQRTPREIVLESTLTQDEVEQAVRDALKDPAGLLSLVDEALAPRVARQMDYHWQKVHAVD